MLLKKYSFFCGKIEKNVTKILQLYDIFITNVQKVRKYDIIILQK